jgi:hypothetical protein
VQVAVGEAQVAHTADEGSCIAEGARAGPFVAGLGQDLKEGSAGDEADKELEFVAGLPIYQLPLLDSVSGPVGPKQRVLRAILTVHK